MQIWQRKTRYLSRNGAANYNVELQIIVVVEMRVMWETHAKISCWSFESSEPKCDRPMWSHMWSQMWSPHSEVLTKMWSQMWSHMWSPTSSHVIENVIDDVIPHFESCDPTCDRRCDPPLRVMWSHMWSTMWSPTSSHVIDNVIDDVIPHFESCDRKRVPMWSPSSTKQSTHFFRVDLVDPGRSC